MLLLSASLGDSKIVFLNNPEEIRKPGILSNFNIEKDKEVELFLHYINKSKREIKLHIESDTLLNNAKVSIHTNEQPGKAGALAVYRILDQKSVDNLNINRFVRIPVNETLSMIVKGTPINNSKITVYIDNKKNYTTDAKTIIWKDIYKEVELYKGFKRRIGTGGDYGRVYKLKFNNTTGVTKKYSLIVSARGGPYELVILNNKTKELISRKLKVYRYTDLNTFILKNGESISFYTIITGGFCLPLEFTIKER